MLSLFEGYMISDIFLICVFWIIYVYIGYPLLVYVLGTILNRNPVKGPFEPKVTILIPAFNEKEHIAETIENKLQLEYPKNKVEIIVISDESNDGTDEIVRKYISHGVKLIRQVPRQGKTSGLNLAMNEASGDIIVFSDANSMYDKKALKYLSENFFDPKVGYVTGKMVYANTEGKIIGDGCSSYMRYENFIRKYETHLNSVVGVDGGIDAVRKNLYVNMKPDQLPDFVLPLNVSEQGFRVVYEDRALLKEESLSSTSSEFRMRVRVALRAIWALYDKRKLFNPFRYPIFSWELISHKLLRYLVFIPQFALLLLNIALLFEGEIYIWFFVMQILFYFLCVMGYIAEKKKKATSFAVSVPYYILVLNCASAFAFFRFLRGEKVVLWKPRVG